jgi:hypothetical protein
VHELNWSWIGLGAVVPTLVGVLFAYPFWHKDQMIFGNIVGTGIMFGSAFGLIMREHAQIDRVVQACLDAGVPCWPEPSAFTRYAVYAFIGLIQVFALFSLSLKVEFRRRRRDYAPEWQ